MKNLPVHWYEGLFLRPHHFQAAERHSAELQEVSQRWDHPYGYGIKSLRFSEQALANQQFQIDHLQVRMPDGTLVNLEYGQQPDRLNLKGSLSEAEPLSAELADGFEKESTIRVYLAIAKLKLGRANVNRGDSNEATRYRTTQLELQDESRGGNDQEVDFLNLDVRLLLSTQDLSGYELCPLAQIRRSGEGDSQPRLDLSYIPPLLSIDAWPALGRDIVRATYDMIGQKLEVLSQQILSRGIGLESNEPGDADRILMLNQLNSAFTTLGVLAFAQGVHPCEAYRELCRIVGQLSIFGDLRRAEAVPPYDHEDLARIFTLIKARIETLLNSVRSYKFEQRYFIGVGLGMQVSLEPRWFNSDWKWYIGVFKGDLSEQECRDLLSAGNLDWKLGSSRQVEFLFSRRAEGVVLVPADHAIRALPSRRDWVYYEVPRTDQPAWRDVQETQTLAMRLRENLIVNRDRLQGERTLVVSSLGRTVSLQFALFAVPQAT
ncbi:MAG: type VI secretion system baseplate subunit TssK [Planctomycetaceae bacterium]|nr:MAG: type VI secretion system baseplate subunit TssK [Planctomycetaceae bacterium]